MAKTLDWNNYLDIAAQTAAEGIVMLKNDNHVLPLTTNKTVSVFGRIQLHYYKSGTGSGGMVNVKKVTGIVDGLREAGVPINETLYDQYCKWDAENPFDTGSGWGGEPWAQEEMPLTDKIVQEAAKASDTAIVIIGRTAGEEQDSLYEAGSFLLTDKEQLMLRLVRKSFTKMIALLNVGGIMDMEFIEGCNPDAILYVWQGGMTGGTGTAKILTGEISPCGKLPDTIAYHVQDYPSHSNFGDEVRDFYCEDIFVGYRYFETFARDKVRYPFGFGLSYTSFEIKSVQTSEQKTDAATADNELSAVPLLTFTISVTNTGAYKGKEVAQLYCSCPQGKLGKAARVLCGFAKTKELAPGQTDTLTITVDSAALASYDDSGVTGHINCNVLEAGDYVFYLGSDVRSAVPVHTFTLSDVMVTEQLSQAMAPVLPFNRMHAYGTPDGLAFCEEAVPLSRVDEAARRLAALPAELVVTGDRGIKLADVLHGKHTMDEFIAQLSDYDLSCIIRGEGMGSPRVTPGTAAAFGGVSDKLTALGIPAACCSDGPSGMRLDCGTTAFSLPNGTLIASTFNTELVKELFTCMGLEMAVNKVECLLGPGMNIHRHPLNGRNFEYFSEDPFLTGTIAAAELQGMQNAGVTGTIKHFCANNQEKNRHFLDCAVSERALREIYLKGFEIAVKQGGATSIMTTYGSVNGLWTAGSFDLNEQILRREWGFTGFTMTDWWANINERGCAPDKSNFAAMARARNNVYMVCAKGYDNPDNTLDALENGSLTRAELQRNAADICRFLLGTRAMLRLTGEAEEVILLNRSGDEDDDGSETKFYEMDRELTIDLTDVKTARGKIHSFSVIVNHPGEYRMTMTASSTQSELAQIPVTVFSMGTANSTFTWNGTGGKPVSYEADIPFFSRYTAIRLYFAQGGLDLHSIKFEPVKVY